MARKLNLRKIAKEQYGLEVIDLLKQMYFEQNKNQYIIAAELGCTAGSICQWFKKLGIQTHINGHFTKGRKLSEEEIERIRRMHTGKILSPETKRKLSLSRKGKSPIGKSIRFQGRRNRSDGYIAIYIPNHPASSSDGYVMEHRLVMERKLGRFLNPEEEVHHINEVKNDNREENLKLFISKKEHMKFHMTQRHNERRSKKCQSIV